MIIFPLLASAVMLTHAGHDHAELTRPRSATTLQTRIQTIKDEGKQRVVQNLSERLTNLNQTWVAHWENVLSRLTNILTKIETRATSLASEGKNVSELRGAISDAKVAISNAQTVVAEQKTQDYTFTFNSEEDMRANVAAHVAHFKADVRLAINAVQDAREAVRLVLIELGDLTGERVTIEKEARTTR